MFVAVVTKPTAIYFQVVVYRKANVFGDLTRNTWINIGCFFLD